MDRKTLVAYDSGAAGFAHDWHEQPPPTDLHALVRRFFRAAGLSHCGFYCWIDERKIRNANRFEVST